MAHDSQFTAKRPMNGPRQYKPYPAYRDSDVEWLGRIPEHWKKKRLKFFAPFRTTKRNVETKKTTYVGLENIESWTGRLLLDSQLQSTQGSITQFHAGDVLFGKLRPYLAKAACPDFNGVSTSELLVLRPDGCLPRYLLYLLLNEQYVRWIDRLTYGTRMPRVGPEQVGDSFAPLPPLEEQGMIAGFLDRETAKIDALVAKKERLIELMQEKRVALITQAVTKGLQTDAPMRESGVEWIGAVPVHWEIKRLRWAITFQRGHDLPASEREEGKVPLISSSGVFSTHSKSIAIAPGIVTGRYGTIGKFYFINEAYWPLNTTLYSINLHGNEPRFLLYMLIHMSPRFLFYAVKSAVPGVDRNDIHSDPVALPSLAEQRSIATFLDNETRRIDALVAKAREAIELLEELRIALISAGVTGKIDVQERAA